MLVIHAVLIFEEFVWHGTAKNGKAEIDISNTENGIYILKIGKTSLKVIKK